MLLRTSVSCHGFVPNSKFLMKMTMFFTAAFLTVTVKINNLDLWELNYEAILTIDDKIAWDTLSSGTFITICFYFACNLLQKGETKKCRKKQQTNIDWRGWVGRDPVVWFSKNNTPHLTPITESGMTKPLIPKLRPRFELLFVLVHNYAILNILEYYQSNTLQIEVYLVMLRSFLGVVCILLKGT